MKRVLTVILVVCLVFALGSTALAAGEGSITVNGTTQGKTYNAYKIFDLTRSGTSVAYTIDPDWTAFFSDTGAGAAYIVTTNVGGNLSQIVVGGEQRYISITDQNVPEFAQKALKYIAAQSADYTKVADGTSLEFDNLDLGYYLVYPQGATNISEGNASLCSLTSTTPDATVNIKATYPTITKKVDDETVDIGQTVTYTIEGKVPDTTGYTEYTYTVSDTLSNGLTFNNNVSNFSITINGTAVSDVAPKYDAENNGFNLTIDMIKYQANIGSAVVITYSAVVNKDAVIGSVGNPNSATLRYSNDPSNKNSTDTTAPVVKKVYTAAIKIEKIDANNKQLKLEGAKFVLKDNENKYYKFTAATETAPERVEWVANIIDGATVVTTDAQGNAEFKGLENGVYYIEETKAPGGYNMLTEPKEITINYANQTQTLFETATIANSSGSVLPTTGGIGTTVFYIVGSLLVVGTVVLLITKKKMSARKD